MHLPLLEKKMHLPLQLLSSLLPLHSLLNSSLLPPANQCLLLNIRYVKEYDEQKTPPSTSRTSPAVQSFSFVFDSTFAFSSPAAVLLFIVLK